jgi:CubicO group peptidase (beta-lactamase class C family)
MKNLVFIILALLLTNCNSKTEPASNNSQVSLISSDYQGISFEETTKIRKEFTWSKWRDGGDLSRYLFLNFPEFKPHTIVEKYGSTTKLHIAFRDDVANFITNTRLGNLKLSEYVRKSPVNGILILHKGRIVFQDYPRMFDYDKHRLASVSKCFLSTLIGILEDQNKQNVTKSIDFYLPELIGSGWQGIKVIDILNMSSGMCNAPEECWWGFLSEFEATKDNAKYDSLLDFMLTVESVAPPGQTFDYNNLNTILLTILIERVSGRLYADFLNQEIWHPMGAQSDAVLQVSHRGDAFSIGGISATLKDVARFGYLFTPLGMETSGYVISDTLLWKIQNPINSNLRTNSWFSDEIKNNSYQWDEVYEDGDFFKLGLGTQGLYVSPRLDLVIAFFGMYETDKVENQLPLISRQLATSNLFK